MNILLVDDEPLVLKLIESEVEKVLPDDDKFAFTSATQAMDFAKETKIDIAFLDINMRILDGITMAKQLQELYPKINIIFCTGYDEHMKVAFDLYASGYLAKPVTEEKIRDAVAHLRYHIGNGNKSEPNICFHCFGNFEAYYKGVPIKFKYKRSKEFLAYLVDRNGVDCTTQEIIATLFGDRQKRFYYNNLRQDLIAALERVGERDVIRTSKGNIGINRDKVKCDYFDFKDGKITEKPTEYMTQYKFGEGTFS